MPPLTTPAIPARYPLDHLMAALLDDQLTVEVHLSLVLYVGRFGVLMLLATEARLKRGGGRLARVSQGLFTSGGGVLD